MTVTLPAEMTYGRVVGRWILAVADTPNDPDDLPEAQIPSGTVSFTRINTYSVRPDTTQADGTYVGILKQNVSTILGSDGELRLSPTAPPGVWLVTGFYKVNATISGMQWPSFDIEVTTEHTQENPLDLIHATPIVVSPTTVLVPSYETKDSAEAAAASTEQSAIDAAQSATEADLSAQSASSSAVSAAGSAASIADALPMMENLVDYNWIGSGSPYGVLTPTSKGIEYTDTAQTNGARKWISTGTTNTSWVVTDGDTGWRRMLSSDTDWAPAFTSGTAQTISGFIYVRRVNNFIELIAQGLSKTTTGAVESDGALPSEWWPKIDAQHIGWNSGMQSFRMWLRSNGTASHQGPVSLGLFTHVIRFSALNTAWPTTLPGTPA